jgi:hypothetical protein
MQLLGRLVVSDSYLLAFSGKVLGQSDATASGADDQRSQTWSRTRATAAIAETSPAPQKVSAIRFSDQPSWWNV